MAARSPREIDGRTMRKADSTNRYSRTPQTPVPGVLAAVVLAVAAFVLSWFLAISAVEWIIVILMIGFVLAAEAFNTALEELCDKFKTDPDPHIAKIKDLSAAAVLIASATALIAGIIIFVPRFLALL